MWLEVAPVQVVYLPADVDVVVDVLGAEFFDDVFAEIDEGDPSVFYFLKPFFVVAVIGNVEIQDVFADEDEFVDAVLHDPLNDVEFEEHNVIVDGRSEERSVGKECVSTCSLRW